MSSNEELKQLKSLFDKGILTQEEFEDKKKLLENQQVAKSESPSDSPIKVETNKETVL